ncbi:hypothetical protein [Streptomyces sp. NPDC055607]
MRITFDLGLPRDDAPVKLTPVYDARHGFSVELWENGQLADVHGPFPLAADAVESSDAFLAARGIRRLTPSERTRLHMRLVAAQGGLFRAVVVRELADRQDEAAFRMADEIDRFIRQGGTGWFAINVEDGGSDGRLYSSFPAARDAQNDHHLTYMPVPAWPWTPDECAEHLALMDHLTMLPVWLDLLLARR